MLHNKKLFGPGQRATLNLAAAALTATLGLGGCGGGGDDTGVSPFNQGTQTPPKQTATPVSASAGVASRYLGIWQGECGMAVINGKTTYLKYKFSMSSANANVAQGQLSMTTYADIRCETGATVPTQQAITLTVSAQPVAASGSLTGQADRVSLTGGIGMPSTLFIAFSTGYNQFWLSGEPIYTHSTISYQKL